MTVQQPPTEHGRFLVELSDVGISGYLASVLLFVMAVSTVASASYASAFNSRWARTHLSRRFQRAADAENKENEQEAAHLVITTQDGDGQNDHSGTSGVGGNDGLQSGGEEDIESSLEEEANSKDSDSAVALHDNTKKKLPLSVQNRHLVLSLKAIHGVYFVLMASPLLVLSIFFNLYKPLVVIYAVGSASSVSSVLVGPLSSRILQLTCPNFLEQKLSRTVHEKDPFETSFLSLVSLVLCFGLGAVWSFIAFTDSEPHLFWFYWIYQNVMGVCAAVEFSRHLVVDSMRVAAIVSLIVFCYDFFFIFFSHRVFGGDDLLSIETPTDSESCNEENCRWGVFEIPIILTVPWFGDDYGRYSLLGLGDILLPSLLVSLAARLDEAKRIAQLVRLQVEHVPNRWWQGYFFPLIVAYTLGLVVAGLAMVFMGRAQPALVYIMPISLAAFGIVGRHEYKDLWQGPERLRWARNLVWYAAKEIE